MSKPVFANSKYGFWKQINPEKFEYSQQYKQKQSTNENMAYLRIGWLSSFFDYEQLSKLTVVDIGSGNGTFVDVGKNVFGKCVGYDVCGESITQQELNETKWDMIVLSDVLEHFDNIDDLYKLNWKYAFISFPETPKDVKTQSDLEKWKHFKPNEHLWCLNLNGFIEWATDNQCEIIGYSNTEDIIRSRWNKEQPNITSVLLKH